MLSIKLMLLGIAFLIISNVVVDVYILISMALGLIFVFAGLLIKDKKPENK